MKNFKVVITAVIIAVLSFWAGGHYGEKPPQGPDAQGPRKVLYYSDPMNPGFRTEKPGIAPCGMPLEPVYADAGDGHSASLSRGAVMLNLDRQQLIGVKVAAVETQPMTYTLRLYGKVVPDETRVYRVNASTDSWIRELSDVTTGSIVRKDQLLAEALAPAYYNAQVTYLIAMDNVDRIKQQLGGQLRHQQGDLANNQIRMAVQALQNLGIGDAQIEELANTRQARPYLQVRAPTEGVVLRRSITRNQWFKAAEEFYTIADIRRVWIYADVYENEARHLRPGMTVQVKHAQLGKTFDARVNEVLPLFDPLSKTLKVRLDVSNPRYDLRPDMFVDVAIPITMPPSLHVPADAVIDSGTKTVVYVDMGNGIFEPRRVETGWRLGRRIEITGGIMSNEKVVVSGNFLIDSESRMKTAAAGPAVTTSKDPVCGMYVDKEMTERSGKIVQIAGRTYYFCSQQCMQLFGKKPQTYMDKERPLVDHAATPGRDLGWVDIVHTGTGGQISEQGSDDPQTDAHDYPGKQTSSTAVIDWDGPSTEKNGAPAKDWKGWGKFPGAEYLGLKHRKKDAPGGQPDAPGPGSAKTTEAAHDSRTPERGAEMDDDLPDGQSPQDAGRPADQ